MSEEVEDPVLSLASHEQLFDEFARRYVGVVLIFEKRDKVSKADNLWDYEYAGGAARALGLCIKTENAILNESDEDEDDA
jgi:hypothetical protein